MDEEKLIILVQGHECLCNLQHKDYDNNLVKDNSWKEIVGELHAQDKELSRRTQHCRRMAGSWQVHSSVVAVERHGMCESAFNAAGEWHGNSMVCVNRPLSSLYVPYVRCESNLVKVKIHLRFCRLEGIFVYTEEYC
jgi:hypothetical protein